MADKLLKRSANYEAENVVITSMDNPTSLSTKEIVHQHEITTEFETVT